MSDREEGISVRSPFRNTYGGLDLFWREDDGGELQPFLSMEDCFGPDIFGPLTENQLEAFYVLCEVKEQ